MKRVKEKGKEDERDRKRKTDRERGGKAKDVKGGQLPLVYVTASPSNGSLWVQMWCS